jgi:Protein of unknown function (DUF4242)
VTVSRGYLAETYAAGSSTQDVQAAAERASAAAAALTAAGHPIRYVRTVFVPEDETCFYFFEAAAPQHVADAVRSAGIDYERIVEANFLR